MVHFQGSENLLNTLNSYGVFCNLNVNMTKVIFYMLDLSDECTDSPYLQSGGSTNIYMQQLNNIENSRKVSKVKVQSASI